MNKKTLVLCLSILAVMFAGLAVAVGFLYSGTGTGRSDSSQVADESRYLLLRAVPSDAVAVFCFSDMEDAPLDFFSNELTDVAGSARTAVSVHHCGASELKPLYVFDAGRTSDTPSQRAVSLIQMADSLKLYSQLLDCSVFPGSGKHLSGRSLVLVSSQENLVRSSVRHLQEGLSIMDAPGFADASASVGGRDVLFIANEYVQRLIGTLMSRSYSRYSSFFSHFADWTVFDMEDSGCLVGTAVYEKGTSDFMEILEQSQPVVSSLSAVLPSYTVFASSLAVRDADAYIASYEGFVDSRQELARYRARQKELARDAGMTIEDFVRLSAVEEVAKASFKIGGKLEQVNLVRVGKEGLASLFDEDLSARSYSPSVHDYRYAGFISSVFGKLFELEDESCYTYVGGWIVSGSRKAIEEYADGSALEYTLADQMADAGQEDLLAAVPVVFQSYFSFTEDKDMLGDIFSRKALPYVSSIVEGSDYSPVVTRVFKEKKDTRISVDLIRAEVKRTKAPEKERDTTVVVPQGPYEVMNSGTGKMNRFYQNSHLSLCLSEEGKDLWGIPFKDKICGYARTIDYYANGKLQILFGAGTKIYLIDRLGRFVKGFPVELGKEILLGPEPYDFNGTHKYNAMVLHKDNTIEMYNLKGQKPDSWKGIKAEETIKSLPELITVGGKSFWVVRTSIQTLIFPFVGGEPVTKFEGDRKIRPDSPVTVQDVTSVEVECYDGHKRTIKLK